MPNEFFTPSSVPANSSPGTSATIRAEFTAVATAFNKLPAMLGNGGELVAVNAAGTALEASGVVPSSFVSWSSPGTLTNKIINWADNTIGTIPLAGGGTGAINLAGAQAALGIDLKANAYNAVLTGIPVAETAPPGTNTTRLATTEFVLANMAALGGAIPGIAAPTMNAGAVGVAGVAPSVSHEDHVHPIDTSRMAVAGGTFSGTVSGPTPVLADDNTTKLATTAWVNTRVASVAIPESQVTNLVSDLAAKAPLNSPTFTGTPSLTISPTLGDNTTKLASTAFVKATIDSAAAGSLGLTFSVVPLVDSGATGTIGTSGDAAHADHVHPRDTTKQDTITGAATTITGADLTINRALVSNSSGKIAVSAVTDTELGRLAGVTDVIQTQINGAAKLAVENVWTAQQVPLGGSATATTVADWNCDTTGQVYDLTVGTTDFTMNAPSNVNNRACYILRVTQHATTARAITSWNAAYKFPGGIDPILSTALGAVDIFTFIGGAGNVMHCVGQAKGLA